MIFYTQMTLHEASIETWLRCDPSIVEWKEPAFGLCFVCRVDEDIKLVGFPVILLSMNGSAEDFVAISLN